MAYGRDTQAEEILIEALRKDPHRVAIHVKLLEIYANRRSLKQFDTLASELYAQTGGVGSEWEKAAAMGIALDPRNPLYRAEAKVAGEPTAPDLPAGAATVVMPGALDMMAAAASEAAPALELPPVTLPDEPVAAVDSAALDLDFASPATPDVAAAPVGEFTPEGTLIMGAAGGDHDLAETVVDDKAAAGDELVAEAEALDFDLAPAPQAVTAAPQPAEEPVIEEIAALDFTLGGEAPAAPSAAVDETGTATIVNPDVLRAVTAADADALTLDFGSAPAVPQEPAPAFDMTSINLDLSADDGATAASAPAAPEGGSDEAGTKLALARAYLEMGAEDQARELLDELIAESPGALADQARELLGRLSG
jgi:pilus assembly protein FimV